MPEVQTPAVDRRARSCLPQASPLPVLPKLMNLRFDTSLLFLHHRGLAGPGAA